MTQLITGRRRLHRRPRPARAAAPDATRRCSTTCPPTTPTGYPPASPSRTGTVLATAILRAHHVDGVIHLASRKSAADSLTSPLDFYRHNVVACTACSPPSSEPAPPTY